jgi:RNA polymerase sigma factor (sigma-70 family)
MNPIKEDEQMCRNEAVAVDTLAALIAAAQNPDVAVARDAQDQLFLMAHPRVLRYAQSLVKSHDAEDLAQDAMLTAFRKLHQLSSPNAFFSWLRQITHNLAMNHLTRGRKFRQLDVEAADQRVSDESDAATLTIQQERMNIVRNCLNRLPADQQTILRMHHVEEVSLVDIAEMYNIPVGTAKSRSFTARGALRALLEAQAV